MHHPVVGALLVELEDALAARLKPAKELVSAVGVFDIEQREVGGEPFTQPNVIPIRLGHGVAEPLVRDLVNDDVAPAHAAVTGH